MPAAIPKDALLRRLGYAPDDALLELLDAEGISPLKKAQVSPEKEGIIRTLLAARFIRVCTRGTCRLAAPERAGGRAVTTAATPQDCELCGGSPARAAAEAMAEACRRAGWTRLCVVGGSPTARDELRALVAPPLELRLIDGSIARTRTQARQDLGWAHHLVLWGSTILDHKVSTLYEGATVSTVNRRGVAELCAHVAAQAERRRA